MSTSTHSTYKLFDSKFKTPQISPILKSAKIWHLGNKALHNMWIINRAPIIIEALLLFYVYKLNQNISFFLQILRIQADPHIR